MNLSMMAFALVLSMGTLVLINYNEKTSPDLRPSIGYDQSSASNTQPDLRGVWKAADRLRDITQSDTAIQYATRKIQDGELTIYEMGLAFGIACWYEYQKSSKQGDACAYRFGDFRETLSTDNEKAKVMIGYGRGLNYASKNLKFGVHRDFEI